LNFLQPLLTPYIKVGLLPSVIDFANFWQDGIAFLTLCHIFKPELVPEIDSFLQGHRLMRKSESRSAQRNLGSQLQRAEWRSNLNRAFTMAEEYFGIQSLLDADEITDHPDEKCIIIYLYVLYLAMNAWPR
jgi:hypothetical protein